MNLDRLDREELKQQITSLIFGAEALRAQNAALREALTRIIAYCEGDICYNYQDIDAIKAMCAKALSNQPQDSNAKG